MPIPLRGLRSLRTLSGRAGKTWEPYRAYMQITCLEMERARRGAERMGARRRIEDIDARLAEIESEKQRLLRKLGEGPRRPPGGFKIRY